MTKEQLKARWQSKEGKEQYKLVLGCIKSGKPFDSIHLEKYAGRWDLRGISFPKPEKIEDISGYKMMSGATDFKKVNFSSIDFSYANIGYSFYVKCSFNNCLFYKSNLKEIRLEACKINRCQFTESDLRNGFLGDHIGSNSGAFMDTDFEACDLSGSSFHFPIIQDCSFHDCNFSATNFGGSRFKNSKFSGLVDSATFHGYCQYAKTSFLWLHNRVNPKQYPNQMENVDFSEAKLVGNVFSYGVDLSTCKFPDNGDYLLMYNYKITFQKAMEIVKNSWPNNEIEKAESILMIYSGKQYEDQSMLFIDKHLFVEYFESLGEKLFLLLRDLVD